jgi:hypothetical protein
MIAVFTNPRPAPTTADATIVYGKESTRAIWVSSRVPVSRQAVPTRIGGRDVDTTSHRPVMIDASGHPMDMVATAAPAASALPPWMPWTIGGT